MENKQNDDRTARIPPPLGLIRQPTQTDPRLDAKLLAAVARIAPGTELRQGIDDIIRSREGALIVIGEPSDLSFMFSGGMRLDQPFTPQLLYELAKMDGAIIVNSAITKLTHANVQLMPDPTIPSAETGTRHRTAERVAKQTESLVVSISQQRETVTLFVGQSRYQLDPIADVLAKTNQALGTLETYRARLEQVLTRLTALEFQGAVMLDDVLVTVQRAELTTRMAEEIERACVELGEEGRLIRHAARGARGRRARREGGARLRLPRRRRAPSARARGWRRSPGCLTTSCSSSSCWRCSATRPRSTRSTTASRPAATASCRTSRACPTRSSSASSRASPGLEAIVRASQRELESVEGVGAVRAREIREGLRRLQEHNLVDRYLQL